MYKKKKIKLTAKTVDEDPADVKKRHFDMKKLVFFFQSYTDVKILLFYKNIFW